MGWCDERDGASLPYLTDQQQQQQQHRGYSPLFTQTLELYRASVAAGQRARFSVEQRAEGEYISFSCKPPAAAATAAAAAKRKQKKKPNKRRVELQRIWQENRSSSTAAAAARAQQQPHPAGGQQQRQVRQWARALGVAPAHQRLERVEGLPFAPHIRATPFALPPCSYCGPGVHRARHALFMCL